MALDILAKNRSAAAVRAYSVGELLTGSPSWFLMKFLFQALLVCARASIIMATYIVEIRLYFFKRWGGPGP
jgi:hypothetical protein